MTASLLLALEDIETRTKMRIEKINEKKEKRVSSLKRRIIGYAKQLLSYFEAERAKRDITPGSIRTAAGACEWYPGADAIEEIDVDAAIAELQRRGITEALRTTVALNKEYLLEHPGLVEEIPGIAITAQPKRRLRFDDTDLRVEIKDGEEEWTIVVPKRKK